LSLHISLLNINYDFPRMCRYWLRQSSRCGTLLPYVLWRLLDKFWNRRRWSRGYSVVPRRSVYPHGRVHEKTSVTAKVDLLLACLNESVVVVCDLHPHGRVHEKISVTAKVTIGLSWINHTLLCAKGSVYAHGRVHEKISVTAKVNLLLACPEWTTLCCTQRFSIPAWTSTWKDICNCWSKFMVGLSW